MINAWPRLTYFSLAVVSSLHLIHIFFGLKRDEDIHGSVLEELCSKRDPSYALKASFLMADM